MPAIQRDVQDALDSGDDPNVDLVGRNALSQGRLVPSLPAKRDCAGLDSTDSRKTRSLDPSTVDLHTVLINWV